MRCEGGAKNFGRVAKGGGRKILDRQFFWNPKGSMNMLFKNVAKITRFARVIAIYVISRPSLGWALTLWRCKTTPQTPKPNSIEKTACR